MVESLEHKVTLSPGTQHERSDVRIRPLAIFLAALAISLALVCVIVAGLFRMLESAAGRADPPPRSLVKSELRGPPGPRLQVSPQADLVEMQRRNARILGATEWIDREQGVARIPIERAMELVAERGLPQWPAVPAAATGRDTPAESPPRGVAPERANAPVRADQPARTPESASGDRPADPASAAPSQDRPAQGTSP